MLIRNKDAWRLYQILKRYGRGGVMREQYARREHIVRLFAEKHGYHLLFKFVGCKSLFRVREHNNGSFDISLESAHSGRKTVKVALLNKRKVGKQ